MEHLGFIQMLFPGSSGLVLWSEPLPSYAGDLGLTNSFGHVLCFNEQSKQVQAYAMMSWACEFYAQTFFDYFGHPPLLPHRFPLEYHE